MKPIAVLCEHVSFGYEQKLVFNDINFHLHENELTTLIGPNGAGKTTLLKLLLGLLQPDSGRILVFGKNPGVQPDLIGYVPQNMAFDMLFPITVEAVVLQGLLRSRLSKKEKEKQLDKIAGTTLINDIIHKRFSELSGGQRRKVLIARALIAEPRLLILDEPNTNLDLQSIQALYELLNTIKMSTTILLVTHDMSFASDAVDRVLCLGDTVEKTQNIHEHMLDRNMRMTNRHYGGFAVLVRHDMESHEHECCSEPISANADKIRKTGDNTQ